MGKKCKLQKKDLHKLLSIALLVSELTLQWLNPGNHHVHLFIGSLEILVSSLYTGGFLSYGHLFALR